MNGHDYYQELPDNSEQSLETDVMRFIAMIGIIFWLIFSITSAIPQSKVEMKPENSPTPISRAVLDQPKAAKTETVQPQTVQPETAKAETKKPEPVKPEIKKPQKRLLAPSPSKLKPKPPAKTEPKKTVPETVKELPRKNPTPAVQKPVKETIKEVVKKPVQKTTKTESPPQKSKPAPKTQPAREAESRPQPQTKTLSIEFRTLDDLLTLLTKKSVTIFCQIKAPGFDLLFQNDRLNRERLPVYTSTTTIPPILWEIKETKTRSFFLAALQKTYPATGNFPDRKVFVAFADAELEQNIEKIFNRLRNEKRGGTIIISGDGRLDFPEQD